MQINKIFSIYDVKASAYLQPFFMPTVAMAIRAITDCVNDPNHQFSKHTADYTLFELGEFFDDSGKIGSDTPRSLGSLIEFVHSDVVPTIQED